MTVTAALLLIGRIVLGGFFVIASIRNFRAFATMPARRTPKTCYGFAMPAAVTAIGFASQLIGGLAVLLGVYAPWGAALLIVFLVLATALFHNPLRFAADARAPHIYAVLVNLTLCGYCLTVIGLTL